MATAQQLANYVQTTLAAPMLSTDTTATLTSVAGLPTVGNFRLRIDDVSPATTFEFVEVSSVNVGTGVVTFSGGAGVGRGLEGTTAIAHAAGAIVGNDLTAAMLTLAFPLGSLPGGYAQTTTQQTLITTATDVTSCSITVTILAGRRYRLSAICGLISTVSNDTAGLTIMEGATQLRSGQVVCLGTFITTSPSVILTPSAGSHTYKLQVLRVTGTGTISTDASGTNPVYILCEDIGAA